MKKTFTLALGILALVAFLSTASSSPASELVDCRTAASILDEAALRFSSWEGHFRHTVNFASGGTAETEEGMLRTAKGGKMRWEYLLPAGKIAVTDGKEAWLYIPEERRAYKLKLPSQRHLPVLVRLISGKSMPSREFFCVRASRGDEFLTVELGFKDKSIHFRKLAVSMNEKERLITSIRYTDEMENRVSFDFSGGRQEVSADPALFSFTPPPGTRISTELDETALKALE